MTELVASGYNAATRASDDRKEHTMKRMTVHSIVIAAAAAAIVVASPSPGAAQEKCCFNNFRFAGGCMVVPSGSETCASILSYLNSFDAVGRYYCDNTTVRGGWSQVECGDAMNNRPQPLIPESAQPARPAQQQRSTVQPVEPGTAPRAQDANLLQVSAPLQVRFDAAIDSSAAAPGQTVTGRLTQDLMEGDTVIAPAGSIVEARVVPTSYWSDGAGDAFEIQATSITIGDQVVPLNATAASATGSIDTSGSTVNVPQGSLVSFETGTLDQRQAEPVAIAAASAVWSEAFAAEDPDAIVALYADDAVLLPPNESAIFGVDAIRATVVEMMSSGMAIELEDLEINVSGALAYKAGRYRMRSADGTLLDRGKFIEIWSNIDGEWKLHRDIWNSSLPMPESHDHDQ
jgi:ketosteroid isomerase-like protein